MIDFILLSLPIFGVAALGWAALRLKLATPEVLDVLGSFSFRFALPALLFRLIASQPLGRSFDAAFFGGYMASGMVIFALVLLASHLLGRRGAAPGAHATTATVSNLGFLGPPLMLAFFGEKGAGPLAMAIVAEIMILLSVGGVIMGIAAGGADGNASGISRVLRGALLNPVVVAIVLGACLAATGVVLPVPIDRLLAFLGSAAGPTALFALGGVLAVHSIDRSTIFAAVAITIVKLLIYPLLVWYVLAHLLQVEPFWIHAGVMLATLPSAGSNYILAQRYAAETRQVSAAIVLSTMLSVLTVPLAAWLMLGQ